MKKQINGQLNLFDYISEEEKRFLIMTVMTIQKKIKVMQKIVTISFLFIKNVLCVGAAHAVTMKKDRQFLVILPERKNPALLVISV